MSKDVVGYFFYSILEFIDKQNHLIRQWKIIGSNEYGLPCALDESIYIGLLVFTKNKEFKKPKINLY